MTKFPRLAFLPMASLLLCQTALAAENGPTIVFNGRIQADYTNYGNDQYPYADGSEVRRLRGEFNGNLNPAWDYRIQYDFAPDEPEAKDIYVRYNGIENTRFTIGNFKVFAGLEELTSSNNMTFIERGLPNALVTQRRMGVGFQRWSARYSFAAAIYGNESNNLDRGKGVSARFAYRPDLGQGQLLHLGVNASMEDNFDDDRLRLRTRPEAHQDSHRIIDTGNLAGVDQANKLGLEGVYVSGPFSLQGEYISKTLERKSASDATFDGYYAQVSYFLTDDTRAYSNSDAIFGTIVPSQESGAWEVAARISNLNLDDGAVRGGEADAVTLGVNYYMTRDLRFSANYVLTEGETPAGSDEPNALVVRVRFTW